MTKRTRSSAEFKAKAALDAIREALTTADLSKTYGLHPTMISGWSLGVKKRSGGSFERQTLRLRTWRLRSKVVPRPLSR